MEKYRDTYVSVNLKSIKENVKKIITAYSKYKYYIGVVKADSYGHYDLKTVKAIIEGGCNYLAVSSLEEALVIRKQIKDIPIMCLGYIDEKYVRECINNNITITINSFKYLESLDLENAKNLKIHIKIDTGMNRLGIKDIEELIAVVSKIKEKQLNLEGIFTHIYDAQNAETTNNQLDKFRTIIEQTDLTNVPIIHAMASDALIKYDAGKYINGCRLGIVMYGLVNNTKLDLKSTFSLCSEIIAIKKIAKGETVGYGGIYKVDIDEIIGIVPIGYADGIIRQNTGRTVFIGDKEYTIIGNICMDMLMIKINDTVKLHDTVYILKDNEHIMRVAKHLNTIPYEIICSISKRVPRIYTED